MLVLWREQRATHPAVDLAAAHAVILAQWNARRQAEAMVSAASLEIQRLRILLAKARRDAFGQTSERSKRLLDQLELQLAELEATAAEDEVAAEAETALSETPVDGHLRQKPARRPLPEHLPKVAIHIPIKQISRRLGHSRKLVRAVVRGERTDVFRVRQSSLEPYLPWLDAQWDAGDRNATDLWRRLVTQNFRGSLRVIGEWATRRRRAEQGGIEAWQRVPSARTLARLLTTGRDRLTRAETVTVAAIEAGVPALAEAREVVALSRPWCGRCHRRSWKPGSSAPARLSSPLSHVGWPRTKRRSVPR